MWLDMYAYKRYYLSKYFKKPKGLDQQLYDLWLANEVKFMTMESMYWRKANHIHKFFVDNIQEGEDDCEEYDLPISTLDKLKEHCLEIMNGVIQEEGLWWEQWSTKSRQLKDYITKLEEEKQYDWRLPKETLKYAKKYLPVQKWFFFWDTEYWIYYLYDIISTYDWIESLDTEDNCDYIYSSSR